MSHAKMEDWQLAGRLPAQAPQRAPGAKGTGKSLAGVTILVVEDEALLAFDLRDSLEEAGAKVVGPVPSLSGAIRAATEEQFDAAILDIDLQGKDVFPAAEILLERGLPFLFHTGHGNYSELPERFADVPLYLKPGCPSELILILLGLVEIRRAQH
jgi:CheY-like chemotaxis protein